MEEGPREIVIMRCYYLSDLHLEAQEFSAPLPGGDILIIAGDLCQARCLDPSVTDRYFTDQRSRAMRFVDEARRKFSRIILVAGNHEHYDGIFDDTTVLLRLHLPGEFLVLDNEETMIDGVRFFGTTLWTNFSHLDQTAIMAIRKGMGEYFFVKTRRDENDEVVGDTLNRLRPHHTQRAHDVAWAALRNAVASKQRGSLIAVTHHAPSRLGLNPRFANSHLDPAFASSLDDEIAGFENVPVWIHGHTHVATTYNIGNTIVRSNAYGLVAKFGKTPGFSTGAFFDVQ